MIINIIIFSTLIIINCSDFNRLNIGKLRTFQYKVICYLAKTLGSLTPSMLKIS